MLLVNVTECINKCYVSQICIAFSTENLNIKKKTTVYQ